MNLHSKSNKINFVITIWLLAILVGFLFTIQYFGFTTTHFVGVTVILILLALSNITNVVVNIKKVSNTQSQSEKYGSR